MDCKPSYKKNFDLQLSNRAGSALRKSKENVTLNTVKVNQVKGDNKRRGGKRRGIKTNHKSHIYLMSSKMIAATLLTLALTSTGANDLLSGTDNPTLSNAVRGESQ